MHKIPAKICQHEIVIKKSRFIACASPSADRELAMAYIQTVREQFPDASHHCWAYLIGLSSSTTTAAMSDDGEPGGTAGKPILNVLQHKKITNVVVVVARYFGGIKLGAGGLIRAYSSATQLVMEALPVMDYIANTKIRIYITFAQEQELRHWLSVNVGEMLEINYSERVQCQIALPVSQLPLFTAEADSRGSNVLP